LAKAFYKHVDKRDYYSNVLCANS